jgi:hypothetical protein
MRTTKIMSKKWLFVAAVLGGLGVPTADARAEDWQVRMERLRVTRRQESGGLFSKKGDEPYLFMVAFRSTFKTPKSTRAWRTSIDGVIGSNLKFGNEANIPERMGKVDFKGVTIRTDKDIVAGKFPEVLGVVVVMMESDGTPWVTMRSLADKLVKEVEIEVRELIEKGKLRVGDKKQMDEDIRAAVGRVRSKAKPKCLKALASWLRSWTDPDDLVALETMVFAAVPPGGLLKTDVLAPLQRRIGSNPLVFTGDNAGYHVTGVVRRLR